MSIKTNEFLYDLFCKVLKINEALAFCEVNSGQFLAQMYTKTDNNCQEKTVYYYKIINISSEIFNAFITD
jgi:hypothetical protein